MKTIGIDPDSSKIGVAILDTDTQELQVQSLPFFQLFDLLSNLKDQIKIVKIEAGWLNKKANFHLAKTKAIAEKIGNDVGRNAETGRKIIEMCEYLNLPHQTIKPLQKKWKTPTGKISHLLLKELLALKGIKFNKPKTNQDERDAILIAFLG